MRRTCTNVIHELARSDPRIVFLGSDVTPKDLAAFRAEFPDRCLMEGVSEQHLIGMAAGLAFSGKIPYLNTIATFLTRRCYEQILVDLCVHDLPVRLIGSGGGTVYAPLGVTHIANEDLAILGALPHMTILAPCDAEEMRRLVPLTVDWPHPIYIRMAKGGDAVVSNPDRPPAIGRAVVMREGSQVLLVSTGITTQLALEAAARLQEAGLSTGVLHMLTVKPLDTETLLAHAQGKAAVVTIEEHRVSGGLGSRVAECLLEAGYRGGFRRLGFPDVFTEEHGSQLEIMGKYGLTADNLLTVARGLCS